MNAFRGLACVLAAAMLGATPHSGIWKDVPGAGPVASRGVVALTAATGDIIVNAWSKPTVRWVAHETAASAADLARLSVGVTKDADNLTLNAIPFAGCSRCGVDLSVWVPPSVTVTASSATGDITVSGAANSVIARTSKGDISVEARDADVIAQTEVGNVSARLPSVSGSRRITLSSIVGDVELWLPRRTGATITASTSIGEIASDFGNPQTRLLSQALQTKTGSGGVQVRLATHTGNVGIYGLR